MEDEIPWSLMEADQYVEVCAPDDLLADITTRLRTFLVY